MRTWRWGLALAVLLVQLPHARAEDRKAKQPAAAAAALRYAWSQFGKEVQPEGTAEQAGDRALGLVRSDGRVRWYFYCTRFVRKAYGKAANWADAKALRDAAGAATKDKSPPAGALVFWKWLDKAGRDVGHVGLHVSSGNVIHTGTDSTRKERGVVVDPIDTITTQLGTSGAYVGWVDPTSPPLSWGAKEKSDATPPAEDNPQPAAPPALGAAGTYRVDAAKSVKAYLSEEMPGFDPSKDPGGMVTGLAHAAYKPARRVEVQLFGDGTCTWVGFGDDPARRMTGSWTQSGTEITIRAGRTVRAQVVDNELRMRVWSYTKGLGSKVHWRPINVTATDAQSSRPVFLKRTGDAKGSAPTPPAAKNKRVDVSELVASMPEGAWPDPNTGKWNEFRSLTLKRWLDSIRARIKRKEVVATVEATISGHELQAGRKAGTFNVWLEYQDQQAERVRVPLDGFGAPCWLAYRTVETLLPFRRGATGPDTIGQPEDVARTIIGWKGRRARWRVLINALDVSWTPLEDEKGSKFNALWFVASCDAVTFLGPVENGEKNESSEAAPDERQDEGTTGDKQQDPPAIPAMTDALRRIVLDTEASVRSLTANIKQAQRFPVETVLVDKDLERMWERLSELIVQPSQRWNYAHAIDHTTTQKARGFLVTTTANARVDGAGSSTYYVMERIFVAITKSGTPGWSVASARVLRFSRPTVELVGHAVLDRDVIESRARVRDLLDRLGK